MRHFSLSSTGMIHRTTSGVRIDCSSSLVPTSLPLHCQQLSACRTETRTIATNYSLLFRRLSLYLTSMGYITTCAVRLAHAHASCHPSCWYPAIRDWLHSILSRMSAQARFHRSVFVLAALTSAQVQNMAQIPNVFHDWLLTTCPCVYAHMVAYAVAYTQWPVQLPSTSLLACACNARPRTLVWT